MGGYPNFNNSIMLNILEIAKRMQGPIKFKSLLVRKYSYPPMKDS